MEADTDHFPESIIVSKWTTRNGITVTKKAYVWSYPDYDDFEILEYTFENTGDSDGDGAADLGGGGAAAQRHVLHLLDPLLRLRVRPGKLYGELLLQGHGTDSSGRLVQVHGGGQLRRSGRGHGVEDVVLLWMGKIRIYPGRTSASPTARTGPTSPGTTAASGTRRWRGKWGPTSTWALHRSRTRPGR